MKEEFSEGKSRLWMKRIKSITSLMVFLILTAVLVISFHSGKGWAEDNAFDLQLDNTQIVAKSASVAIQCTANTYYVNAVDGVDSNDGRSPETAWQTISKVNQTPLGPGDCVFFKRGQVWREELSIYFLDGTANNPIVFSAYGEGPKPEINGADIITEWTQHSGNIWRTMLPNGAIQGVWFDGQRGQKVDSIGAVSQETQWFTEETTVYVYSSSNPASRYTNPGVEVAQRMTCINDSSEPSSYIVIDNFRLTHNGAVNGFAGAIDVRERGDGYWTIQNVEIEESAVMSLMLRRSYLTVTNSVLINNDRGVLIHDDALNNTIEHSEIAYSFDGGGISMYGHGHTISYNKVHHNKWNGIFAWHAPPAEGEPIEENYTSNHTIIYNKVFQNGLGAGEQGDGTQLDGLWLGNMDDSVVAYNLVYDNVHGQGIHLDDGCERNLVSNNTIFGHIDNGSIRYSVGIHLEHGFNGRNNGVLEYVSNNTIVNNNIFNNYMAIAMTAMKSEQAPEEYETNYLNNNNYWVGPDGHHLGRYLETSIYSFEDWKSMTGQDADSISVDPHIAKYPPSQMEDFRLTAESTCIDTGVDVGFTHDFEGNLVPQGIFPDLGAFEFGSQAPVCDGDLDDDGDFDSADVDLMVTAILDGNSQNLCADLDDDGQVNVIDLQMLVIKSLE
jgi:hypothetical protein